MKTTKASSFTAKSVDSFVKHVETMIETVSGASEPLTKKQRTSLLKPLRGGRALAHALADLAKKHGVDGLVSIDAMKASLHQAETLAPLALSVAELSRRLDDALRVADSKTWKVATKTYSILRRLAADDSTLAREMAPFVRAFARPRKATKKTTSSTPPDATHVP